MPRHVDASFFTAPLRGVNRTLRVRLRLAIAVSNSSKSATPIYRTCPTLQPLDHYFASNEVEEPSTFTRIDALSDGDERHKSGCGPAESPKKAAPGVLPGAREAWEITQDDAQALSMGGINGPAALRS